MNRRSFFRFLAIAPLAATGAVAMVRTAPAFSVGGMMPTTFPMRSGYGLVGECGGESIMPLHRGAWAASARRFNNLTVNVKQAEQANINHAYPVNTHNS